MGIASLTRSALQTGRHRLRLLFIHKSKAGKFLDSASESAVPAPQRGKETTLCHAEITHTPVVACISPAPRAQNSANRRAGQPSHETWAFTMPVAQHLQEYPLPRTPLLPLTVHTEPKTQRPKAALLVSCAIKPYGKESMKSVKRISNTCSGRLFITGRMADVCAELDRMVAYEASGYVV